MNLDLLPGFMDSLGLTEEPIIHYVSSGIPDRMQGECYCESPDALRKIFDYVDPRPAPKKFCVFKPLSQLTESMPLEIFSSMLERYDESFLKSKAWETVKKKIERSRKTWGEDA